MTGPTIAVAIPCYRYGAMLPTAVGSVLDQDGVEVRIRIIDDASGDGSAEVARELAATDSRIEVVEHERNRGHIATFSEGVTDWASAEFTVLMSADDALTPGSLRRATALMQAHPAVSLVYGAAINWFGEMPLPTSRDGAGVFTVHSGQTWLAARFAQGANCVSSPTAVARTSTQTIVGGYDPELLHTSDLDMWMRLALHGDVGFVGGADQAYCRGHAANMSVAYEETDGGVGDLRMRLRAFIALVEKADGRLADAQRLEQTVRRRLAADALIRVARSYDRGAFDARIAEQLLGFAAGTYDEVARLPQWHALTVRRLIGPRVMPRLRYFVFPALGRRMRQVSRERRLVQKGV